MVFYQINFLRYGCIFSNPKLLAVYILQICNLQINWGLNIIYNLVNDGP